MTSNRVASTDALPPPDSAADTAECPECCSALFPAPAPGPFGWRWSHEPDGYYRCPNDPVGRGE